MRVSHQQAKPVQTSPPVEVQIIAGQTATIEFKLPRAVRVTGKVVDELTDEPIAGAKVYAWNNEQGSAPPLTSTDKDGSYSLEIAEGQIGVEVREVPLPHYIGVRNTTSESSKTGQKTVEMPPLRVPRGRRVEGFVVDEQGRPVDAAWVGAQWWEEQNGLMTTGGRSTRADKEGRFVLEAVSSKVEVYLRADTPERRRDRIFHRAAGSERADTADRLASGRCHARRPGPARRPRRIWCTRRAHHREPDAQRRGDPPRRRHPHGAAMSACAKGIVARSREGWWVSGEIRRRVCAA